MSDEEEKQDFGRFFKGYGEGMKRVMFADTVKRYADFRIRIHLDELKQQEFFRAVLTGYIEQDEDFLKFLDKHKDQARLRKKKLKKSYDNAKKTKDDFRLTEDEIENIFDIIAEECDEL